MPRVAGAGVTWGDLELDALTVTRNRNGKEEGPFTLWVSARANDRTRNYAAQLREVMQHATLQEECVLCFYLNKLLSTDSNV